VAGGGRVRADRAAIFSDPWTDSYSHARADAHTDPGSHINPMTAGAQLLAVG
jgi:hypothetical protein